MTSILQRGYREEKDNTIYSNTKELSEEEEMSMGTNTTCLRFVNPPPSKSVFSRYSSI